MTHDNEMTFLWDRALIEKYNQAGPRYTSYPTALEFKGTFTHDDFLVESQRYPSRPLSLYIHLPFCHKLCYFCACNKQITRHYHKVIDYLDQLEKEIIANAPLFSDRTIVQIHWGGGTPTFLQPNEISRLMAMLRRHFTLSPDVEQSIEIDPREIELSLLDHLSAEGFNRLSIGVQDFDKTVQHTINRVQDETFIDALIRHAKTLKFTSINLDLIYGLPKQTIEGFRYTLKKIIELAPDRLSVFNYAHIPARFPAQQKFHAHDFLPAGDKLSLLHHIITDLTDAGYHYIGMDHFSKPNDELALVQRTGQLHRNFQGYTTLSDVDLLGLGVSAISMIGNSYSQNHKVVADYYNQLDTHKNALLHGLTLTKDDLLRREVIKILICNFSLIFSNIETMFNIVFVDYFHDELVLLTPLREDGLLIWDSRGMTVTPKGRLLIRNICLCFDIYSRSKIKNKHFSRII